MSNTIRVVFDNSSATYFSGQRVRGRAIINLTEDETLTGVQLRFLGEAYVKWSLGDEGHVKRREVVLEKYIFVIGSYYDEVNIPSGEHEYPFTVNLPSNIPPSFESTYGFVRYTLRGRIIRPQRLDIQCKDAFTVLNIVDLNLQPNLMENVQHVKEKHLYSCCLSSGQISFVVTIPYTGFVPGQFCTAIFEVDNLTGSFVAAQARLYQLVCYKGRKNGRGREMERKVKKVIVEQKDEVEPKKSKTTCANLFIPTVPISSIPICDIICVSYYLRFKVYVPGTFDNDKIYVPVVIGSIPQLDQFSSIVPADTTEEESSAPPDFLSLYPEMPPPSYEECVGEATNIRSEEDEDNIHENLTFAPKYPTYHFK